jgi:hypothetical protein
MSVTKRILGDYNIVNKGTGLTTGNVTITTDTFFINGNFLVGGNSTSVSHTDAYITDNIIVLNKGEPGAGVSLGYAGIAIDRGTSANVQLRWNESITKWQLTTNGTTFGNLTTSLTGVALSNVYDDSAPTLSANLNLYGNKIWSSNVGVQLSMNTPGSGQTGLYVTNNTFINQELINKNKALVYTVLL